MIGMCVCVCVTNVFVEAFGVHGKWKPAAGFPSVKEFEGLGCLKWKRICGLFQIAMIKDNNRKPNEKPFKCVVLRWFRVSEHSAKPTWEGRVYCTQREIIKTISPPQVVEIGDACSQAEAAAATTAFSNHLLHFVVHPPLTPDSERGACNRLRPRKNAADSEVK